MRHPASLIWAFRPVHIFCALIILLSMLIRVRGISFGLPMLTNPDEPLMFLVASDMLRTHSLSPGFFQWGSLPIYLQCLSYGLVYGTLRALGYIHNFAEIDMPTLVYWGRWATLLVSVGVSVLVFRIGSILFGPFAALLSLLTFSFLQFFSVNSIVITGDMLVAFMSLLSLYLCVKISEGKPTPFLYGLAGFIIGASISTKYLPALNIFTLLYAHWMAGNRSLEFFFNRRLRAALLWIPLGFIISTPGVLIESAQFVSDVITQQSTYAHGGKVFSFLTIFRSLGYEFGYEMLYLAIIAALLWLWKDLQTAFLLLIFPVLYIGVLGLHTLSYSRHLVVIAPYLALLIGYLLTFFYKLTHSHSSLLRIFGYASSTALCVYCLVNSYNQGRASYRQMQIITLPSTRWLGKLWFENSIPEGAKVAREYYTPPIDANKFRVNLLGVSGVAKSEYAGVDYLITSSEDYARFFDSPSG